MARYQLPRTPKGFRQPGSGRPKGQPNRVTVELKKLVSELVTNPQYQTKLRRDFQARKLHPSVEALIWNYHLGKPPQTIDLAASVDVTSRLEEERRIFAQLDIAEIEQLAAKSQALVDSALTLSRARNAPTSTQPDGIGTKPTKVLRRST